MFKNKKFVQIKALLFHLNSLSKKIINLIQLKKIAFYLFDDKIKSLNYVRINQMLFSRKLFCSETYFC